MHELLEQLRVVLEHRDHDARERLVVLDACVLLVRVLARVVGFVPSEIQHALHY